MKKVDIPTIRLATLRLPPVEIQSILPDRRGGMRIKQRRPDLLLESGFHILLENGGRILLENKNQ